MSATRCKRGTVGRARKTLRVGPYFRHHAATIDRDGARGGWTSQGFRFRWRGGPITANTTTGRYTWDSPGPGSVSGDIPDWVMRALPKWLTKQPPVRIGGRR